MKKLVLVLVLCLSCSAVYCMAESDDINESMSICVKLEKESQVQLFYTSLSQVQDFMREQAIFKVYVRDCSNSDNDTKPKWLKYSLRVKDKYIKELFNKK
jgi:hypothetical protein